MRIFSGFGPGDLRSEVDPPPQKCNSMGSLGNVNYTLGYFELSVCNPSDPLEEEKRYILFVQEAWAWKCNL